MLYHPEVADRSCADCQKWVYQENGKLHLRQGKPVPRGAHQPTPCHKCPKESPQKAREHEVSGKNVQAIKFYSRQRACGFDPALRSDPVAAVVMEIVDTALSDWERRQAATQLGLMLLGASEAPATRGNRR